MSRPPGGKDGLELAEVSGNVGVIRAHLWNTTLRNAIFYMINACNTSLMQACNMPMLYVLRISLMCDD
jgi:hypothetical protein